MATSKGEFSKADFNKWRDRTMQLSVNGRDFNFARGFQVAGNFTAIFGTRDGTYLKVDGRRVEIGTFTITNHLPTYRKLWERAYASWMDGIHYLEREGLSVDLVVKQAFINQARAEGRDP